MGLRRRLEKLGREAGYSPAAVQHARHAAAAERLSDRELRLLADALRRERNLQAEDFAQLELSPEERQALDAYHGYYEEAKRGA